MKKLPLILSLIVLCAVTMLSFVLIGLIQVSTPTALAAGAPGEWVQGPTHLWRFQSDQTWDSAEATITASPVTAFFCNDLTNGSQVVVNQIGSVSFDPVAIGTAQKVTAGNITVDYGQLAALNAQAALDQWNAQKK